MARQIRIYDSTLRDGAQAEGISFSVKDKLKIVTALDRLGVNCIEAGNPASNPKDLEFFQRVQELPLKSAKIVAFASTRRPHIKAEEDSNLASLLVANTEIVAVFGKAWTLHVHEVLGVSLEENLAMIKDSISFLKGQGKEVIFDAEHFYSGYLEDKAYALACLEAALVAGADTLCLCETNGGVLPLEIYEISREVLGKFKGRAVSFGIHAHNDSGTAVANSLLAVQAGFNQVQGTFNGLGERCGNANLASLIPTLQLKMGYACIPEENMSSLTRTARFISEIANVSFDEKDPYVGKSAFAHKGGMHIDGVLKINRAYEHIEPELVGNERRFLMSEVAGRSTILRLIQEVDASLKKDSARTLAIINMLKEYEQAGYQFEGAESSFKLLIRKYLNNYQPFFSLIHYKIIGEKPAQVDHCSTATIKLEVRGNEEITAADGNGPVNALDKALRKALEIFYPELKEMHLIDYKVRVLETSAATASKVRVLIESTDGEDTWATMGVSGDIIEASWLALVDSMECKLLKEKDKKEKDDC